MNFQIEYTRDALDDLSDLRAFDRQRIADGIAMHLVHQPTTTSRRRIKKRDQPFWSEDRLRVDEFRVYDKVDSATQAVILRILRKDTEQTPKDMP